MTQPTPQAPLTLDIEGATCAGCVRKIETALRAVPGVAQADMNFATRTATVAGSADSAELIAAVQGIGYSASLPDAAEEPASADQDAAEQTHYKKLRRDMGVALALGIPLMLWGIVGDHFSGGDSMMVTEGTIGQLAWTVVGILTLAVLMFPGGHFFRGAWHAFRHHNATMDTLIAVGTGSAWLYSMVVTLRPGMLPPDARHVYFEASAMIIGLVNLGLLLEVRARGKTSQAIRRLLDLRPKTALVVRESGDVELPVEQIRSGDFIRARPGEQIAVDGIVVDGDSYVSEAMLTGEPLPVHKKKGAELAAGTLNQNGALVYRVTRVGKETVLARIIELVRKAQGAKPSIGRLADAVSAVFVPAVLLIAVLAALLWFNLGPEPATVHMLIAATTVLIIACPCALGLATPMSVMVGVGKAAEAGVLIQRGEAIQTAGQLDTIVLDKTGTITEGQPAVIELFSLQGDEQRLLHLAACIEQYSEHPLAGAIVRAANSKNTRPRPATDFRAHNGLGVSAALDGKTLLLGNRRWLEQHGIDCSALTEAVLHIVAQAGTPLFLAERGEERATEKGAEGSAEKVAESAPETARLLGVIGVADRIRADSRAAIARLRARGLHVAMLTGDIEATARAIAKKAGIDEVFAEVLPEHKAGKIEQLRAAGRKVGMVGDGINDAPALAGADVGFAIGTGTDIAIESADITLMRPSLHGVVDAIEISQATLRNIKQNLFGAFIYNLLGIPVAAGALYPLFGILMSPVLAGAAMSLSSVTVVANANRLRLFRSGSNTGESGTEQAAPGKGDSR
jgi:Cu+-exporting ATPase